MEGQLDGRPASRVRAGQAVNLLALEVGQLVLVTALAANAGLGSGKPGGKPTRTVEASLCFVSRLTRVF